MWERELSQVRILIGRGSIAYFLSEPETRGKTGKRCADLVLDGEVTEMKIERLCFRLLPVWQKVKYGNKLYVTNKKGTAHHDR